MAYNLLKINYLNVGYFFLVEFIEKLSVFEISPLVNVPVEKLIIPISNYSIISYSLEKVN